MANIVTQQLLVDGSRNAVVKIVGILDTSDVAATASLTGGATTLGSAVITFTSSTAPIKGQYVTGTGIPASSYILSVDGATQVTLNNAATATNTGLTFTLVAGAIVAVDPAQLGFMDFANQQRPNQIRIDRILYTVEEGLDVRLLWEATANVYIIDLVKAGHQELKRFGGYQNNAGTGKTGRILLATEGWTTGVKEFTILLELVKQI